MHKRMEWRADKLISNFIRMSPLQTAPPDMKNHTSVRIKAEFITSAFDKITKERQGSHVETNCSSIAFS